MSKISENCVWCGRTIKDQNYVESSLKSIVLHSWCLEAFIYEGRRSLDFVDTKLHRIITPQVAD